jgi:hypothetical protein
MTCPIEILCIKYETILKVSLTKTTSHIAGATTTLIKMI